MLVVLMRHGATDWNLERRCQGASDLALNEVGMRQARQVAASLGSEIIHAVYASNLTRARQTAEVISRPHGLPVRIEDSIRELDHGMLEGLTFAEIKENYPDFINKWRTEPAELSIPGGERLIDVAQRSWEGINRIALRHGPGENVVVVSHNFPIAAILCRITGTPLNSYRSFHLDPCGISRLNHHGENGWIVTHINNQVYSDQRTPLES